MQYFYESQIGEAEAAIGSHDVRIIRHPWRVVCKESIPQEGSIESLWVSYDKDGWVIATWTPRIYRFPAGTDVMSVACFVKEALSPAVRPLYDFSECLKAGYGLNEVREDECLQDLDCDNEEGQL